MKNKIIYAFIVGTLIGSILAGIWLYCLNQKMELKYFIGGSIGSIIGIFISFFLKTYNPFGQKDNEDKKEYLGNQLEFATVFGFLGMLITIAIGEL
ncbi:MAG: hypothetical protein IKS15_04715 [Opitutales bacterium]|nr:hypothetical protein [Opitutales bacterium]